MVAKIIQNFNIKLDPTQSMKLSMDLTLRPTDGTRCWLSLRS